jgi:hypothetical protein
VTLVISREVWRKIWNFVLFQAAWFACILGAADQQIWIALSVSAICIGIYLWLHANATSEYKFLLKAFIYGLVVDTLLLQLGWIQFESPLPWIGISPIWMWALWLVFATTLKESMSWLQGKWVLSAVLGAIAGPLCYEAGVRLGAAQWPNSDIQVFGLIYLALAWACAMPLLFYFSQKDH